MTTRTIVCASQSGLSRLLPLPRWIWLRQTRTVIGRELKQHLQIDWLVGVLLVVYGAIFFPTVPVNTENPQRLAAFVNDEPFLTMALDATTVAPYGNPANFFDTGRSSHQSI